MKRTTYMSKFERYLKKMSNFCLGIGQVGIFLIITVIFFDISGLSTIRKPIFGAGEIVAITQLLAISLALPTGLLQEVFPRVTLLTDLLGARAKKFFAVLNAGICTILFFLITSMIFKFAYEYQLSDELIPNINLPLYPFIYITGCLFIIASLVWLFQCLSLLLSPVAKRGDL